MSNCQTRLRNFKVESLKLIPRRKPEEEDRNYSLHTYGQDMSRASTLYGSEPGLVGPSDRAERANHGVDET